MDLWEVTGDTEYAPLGWMMVRAGSRDRGEISGGVRASPARAHIYLLFMQIIAHGEVAKTAMLSGHGIICKNLFSAADCKLDPWLTLSLFFFN